MRIALISTDYLPLRTSAAVQMRDLAQEILRQGHEPVVILACVNQQGTWKSERIEGVEVLRLPVPRTKNIGYLRRTISELLLPFFMWFHLRKSPYRQTKWDLIAWYSPTIFFGPLIWQLKRKSKCPAYLILRDIFPEWAVNLGLLKKGPAYIFFKFVERFQYSMADTIGVQTESNLVYLSTWSKSPNRQLEVLQNWQAPAPNLGSSISIDKTPLSGRKIFVYIGNIGIAQGIDIFIDLAAECINRKDIGFLFVGRGSEVTRLITATKSRALSNVLFFNEVDSHEMPGLLSQCHVGLIALDPRHKTHNIPGKFLTYLLAGLPVLARVNPGTDLEQLIIKNKVGGVYTGDDSKVLRRMAEGLVDSSIEYQQFSKNCRMLGMEMFSPATAAKQIISTIA